MNKPAEIDFDSADRLSVIMTCYNEGPYIGAAVRSILTQTRGDLIDRIVIADDGSEAATLAALRDIEAMDPRILVLYGPGGRGLSAQRNWAAEQVTSPWLAILDGDDVWATDKIERQLPYMRSSGVGLVYSDFFTFPEDNLGAARRAGVRDLSHALDLTKAYFLKDPPIVPSTIVFRRDVFERCGKFDEAIRVFEDSDFFLRMAPHCRFALADAPLLYKRYRTTSITGGRTDLIAHHAYVALKAAARDPRLLPLVNARLAERARKLGNQNFLLGRDFEAKRLLRFATQLNPLNFRAWGSLIAVSVSPTAVRTLMGSRLKPRQAALGTPSQKNA